MKTPHYILQHQQERPVYMCQISLSPFFFFSSFTEAGSPHFQDRNQMAAWRLSFVISGLGRFEIAGSLSSRPGQARQWISGHPELHTQQDSIKLNKTYHYRGALACREPVPVSFNYQLNTGLSHLRRESQLSECPDQSGLWACAWGLSS